MRVEVGVGVAVGPPGVQVGVGVCVGGRVEVLVAVGVGVAVGPPGVWVGGGVEMLHELVGGVLGRANPLFSPPPISAFAEAGKAVDGGAERKSG